MIKRKALIVGIDNYPNAKLKGCVNDAKSIASLLEKNEDDSPNFDVRLECNVPTKGKLKTYIKDLFSGNASVALFYFSGHGYSIDNENGIVTPDFSEGDMGITAGDLLEIANDSQIENKIIILDSCFSGSMGGSEPLKSNISAISKGLTIMTASSEKEPSLERGGHGLFTSLFIKALEGYASDIMGNITPAGIYSFIDQTLGPWDQRPIFKTNTQNFYYLRKSTPDVSLDVLRRIKNYFETENSEFELDPSYEFTNSPKEKHYIKKPYASSENVSKFKELQLYQKIGLVEPVDEDYMYFAAMNNKSCRLTFLGKRYFELAKDGKI
ncbi:caspase family protein [Fructilactobacillus myrtifloralis]|uniref:Caspase family protein n=1 Tax=Fructilactobacillus myrtifloralis TaxID=2940301 RepID=A0ABY5BMA3_9LACO|nr:caspase family protein [Fructilactobacillus myrtifloralis]USS84807.1 caspase family protein [Fructilactobacillus myrtifloralis]